MNPLSRLAQAFYPVPDDAKSLSALANVPELQNSHGGSFASGLLRSLASAVTLPRDAYQGNVDLTPDARPWWQADPTMGRVMDAAGLSMTGGLPVATPVAGETLMASALTRQAKDINELRAALSQEHPNVKYWVSESPSGTVKVDQVVVPPEARGQGTGTQFMRDVLDYADANGKTAALTPSADFGGNKRKLEAWYSSLGFVPNKGRARDFEISEGMYRKPDAGGQ